VFMLVLPPQLTSTPRCPGGTVSHDGRVAMAITAIRIAKIDFFIVLIFD